jgi:putative ABC transport system substrate-binding protein
MCIWDRRMLLTTALVAAVLTAISNQLVAAEIPKVGILYLGSKGTTLSIDAIIKAMEGFGYQDGKTVTFEYRYAEGKIDLLPALAKELVDQNVKVIVAIAGESLVAAAKTTTTVPIVSANAGGDFVAMGLAKSWESPGGNVTGMNLVADDAGMARVEILKKVLPNLRRA